MADIIMHRHHITPIHMGGHKDGPTVLLTISQHAEAHRKLWEEHGLWQDYVAWKCLSGAMTNQEAIRIAISEGGKKASQLHFGMRRSAEARQKMSESAKRKRGGMEHLRDPQMRKAVGEKNVGKKRTLETRQAIAAGATARYQRMKEDGNVIGQPHSLETRKRLSDIRMNMPRNKPMVCDHCNGAFLAQVSIAKYCSDSCRTGAWKKRQ